MRQTDLIPNIKKQCRMHSKITFIAWKKSLLISFTACFVQITVYAQINKFSGNDEIGWPSGFFAEWEENTFVLNKDGDAIKVVSQNTGTALKGKLNHRFTPSVNGEYTLKFKAKKSANEQQSISFNLLRTDAWTDLVSARPNIVIDSDDFKEYTVTFSYREDIKTKTPQGFQLEIYVNGVMGDLWFKDICLYESNNNQVTYIDGFDTDLFWGLYQQAANSWDRTPKTAAERGELKKENQGGNNLLQYTQKILFSDPWNATVTRSWWGQRGVQYRILCDIATSVNMPEAGGIGLEIWNGTEKILPATYFAVTPTIQTKNFITQKIIAESAYSATFFVGKLPANEKMFIDNVLISPIYLYNTTVTDINRNTIRVNWLHSGYLAGDKMDISLINGTDTTTVQSDVEIISGTVTINLPTALDTQKQYKVRLKDKIGNGEYTVHNFAYSSEFTYNIATRSERNNENKIAVYVADDLLNIYNAPIGSTVKIYTLTGQRESNFISTKSKETVHLGKGIYIVLVNNKSYKIIR